MSNQIDGNHKDYFFKEGPIPAGAKSFGFDAEGRFDAKIACIAYSGKVPNAVRGIDSLGNYWCASTREIDSLRAQRHTLLEACKAAAKELIQLEINTGKYSQTLTVVNTAIRQAEGRTNE